MTYQHIQTPANGQKITVNADNTLNVPDTPIIPFIEGDGTGVDITPAMKKVVDAAVAKAYGGKRQIAWMEVYAGEKAVKVYGGDQWLPDETVQAVKDYVISIKGPLTTPTSGGIRSLNVALRQMLDLYVCLRPVRYFKGVPSPVKRPEQVDMVIFRENTEDIYAGIEYAAGSQEVQKLIHFLLPDIFVPFQYFQKGIRRLGHHFHAGKPLHQAAQTGTHQGMIVDEHHSHRCHGSFNPPAARGTPRPRAGSTRAP